MLSRQLAQKLNNYILLFERVQHLEYNGSHMLIHSLHTITCFALHFIVDGRGTYIVNGVKYDMQPGSVFGFIPGMRFEGYSDPDQPLQMYSLRYSTVQIVPEDVNMGMDNVIQTQYPLSGYFQLFDLHVIKTMVERLCGCSINIDDISRLQQRTLFQNVVYGIVEDLAKQKNKDEAVMMVVESIKYLDYHYNENISVEQLAQKTGLSISYYCKLFKKLVGYSPKEYIIRLRINQAKRLLEYSDKSLKKIAKMVGYEDEFYFSRIFKKLAGISPSQFRRMQEDI